MKRVTTGLGTANVMISENTCTVAFVVVLEKVALAILCVLCRSFRYSHFYDPLWSCNEFLAQLTCHVMWKKVRCLR